MIDVMDDGHGKQECDIGFKVSQIIVKRRDGGRASAAEAKLSSGRRRNQAEADKADIGLEFSKMLQDKTRK